MAIKKCLKINVLIALSLSVFFKITLLTVLNGTTNVFIICKIVLHMILIYGIGNELLCILIPLFTIDLILYTLYVLFELIIVLSLLLDAFLFKDKGAYAFVGFVVCGLIAALDMTIIFMIGLAIEQIRFKRFPPGIETV